MPWDVRKTDSGYNVIKQTTGEVVGTHKNRGKAEAQMRALYANTDKPSTSPHTYAHGGKMVLDDSYRPQPITEAYVDGRKRSVSPMMGGGKKHLPGYEHGGRVYTSVDEYRRDYPDTSMSDDEIRVHAKIAGEEAGGEGRFTELKKTLGSRKKG